MLPEHAIEMTLAGKAKIVGDSAQRSIAGSENGLRSFNSVAQEKLMRCGASCLPEQSRKVIWTQANFFCLRLKI